MNYLLKTTETYRVPTVEKALELRDDLSHTNGGTLASFSYTTKYIKEKGEIIEEYQLVKASFVFNDEKEPDSNITVCYEVQ